MRIFLVRTKIGSYIWHRKNSNYMKNYLELLQETASANWDRLSLCNYKGEQFTYGELATSIAKLHTFFSNAGFVPGDKMALCARNSARWGLSFLAINTYGAVAVPLLADFLPSSIENLTEHSESKVLFTDPDIWAKMDATHIKGLEVAISVRDFTLLYSANETVKNALENLQTTFSAKYPMGFTRESIRFHIGAEDELAIINYTSGTTSAPKGVMLTYGNMSATIDFSRRHMPCGPGDTLVSILPMAHMYGLATEFIFPCCMGVSVYYLGRTPSPTLLMKAMKDVKPFMFISVPLVMEKVYKSSIKPVISKWYMKAVLILPFIGKAIYKKIGEKLKAAFGGRIRVFIMGGAALNPEVDKCFKRIRIPYTVGYGMTEACPLLGWAAPEDYVSGSCGRPCHLLRIDSEDPHHIAGEIQVKGPNICIGYYKNPTANANLFTDDGYMHTGDLGIIDKEGNIFIKGRSKNMILSANGQNIYPEELEAVINSQPYVAESIVVERVSKLVALVYLDKDAITRDKLDDESVSDIPEAIRINSNRQLPAYSKIAKVEIVLSPFEKTPKMSIKRFMYK